MESMSFVLFGATGDLAKRKIFPALYNLYLEKKMPQSISIIGLGRGDLSNEDFRSHVEQSLVEFSRRKPGAKELGAFLSSFQYSRFDANRPEDYKILRALVEKREQELNIPENRMFYLSVAPEFFDVIALGIKKSGLGNVEGWKRLVIEKPFGHDLASARELNEKLNNAFEEDEIYRIDHYLGKPMIQNLDALEFANPILHTLWNNRHIANVQITASEVVGVEERAGYYDHTGAIRDMFQNHMLQILMMTAMHLPKTINAENIREEKRKVMESVRPMTRGEVRENVVRGQYAAGRLNGKELASYVDEPGIEASSMNDTFVAARLWIDNDFWRGVPFYIRTGKRMQEKATRIVIEFKNSTKDLYDKQKQHVSPNLLIIEVSPTENVTFQLNSKNPLKGGKIEPVQMNFMSAQKDVPEAYERLIADALKGDSTFFAHWKEVELAWEWVQPILDAFKGNDVPLRKYAAGSNGPQEAYDLLEQSGYTWWLDPEEEPSALKLQA
ncbi:glucose-6-phosphate dehydrogenase [Bacillus sp. 1P06AnD]|uniref:glucose-6-phosphate dehydrogenase n=1 Tax=Bacillus sp. 1P06AnD TaxID=3132208 RepID=UPI0039A3132C